MSNTISYNTHSIPVNRVKEWSTNHVPTAITRVHLDTNGIKSKWRCRCNTRCRELSRVKHRRPVDIEPVTITNRANRRRRIALFKGNRRTGCDQPCGEWSVDTNRRYIDYTIRISRVFLLTACTQRVVPSNTKRRSKSQQCTLRCSRSNAIQLIWNSNH